jgi:ankyrin repeat protein
MSEVSLLVAQDHLLEVVEKNDASLLRTYLEGIEETRRKSILSIRLRQPNTGFTPLCFAVSKGFLEICRILLSFGAIVRYKGLFKDELHTPLQIAVSTGKVDIFELLCQANASINVRYPKTGATLLQMAVYRDNIEIARRLISMGAKPNAPYCLYSSSDRWRIMEFSQILPLFIAVQSNYMDMVRLLIEAGARTRDDSNYSAAEEATNRGYMNIANYIYSVQEERKKQNAQRLEASRSFKRAHTEQDDNDTYKRIMKDETKDVASEEEEEVVKEETDEEC